MATDPSLAPYPAYKDSGVPWLGDVPEHWDVRRSKLFLREINERSGHGSEELLTVSQYTGVTRRRDRLKREGDLLTNAASLVGYKMVQPGDVVMNIMLAWNGSLGVSPVEGIVSPAYCVFRSHADVDPWFLHYLLRTPLFTGVFKTVSTGVVESRLRLYPDEFFRLPAILPPLDEQHAIVRYLNHVDRRIRRFISAKQRLLKLLEEQRQVIIHRAVTRGLDPDVRLKPSGVDWLGNVPMHWEVKKIRQCISISGGMTPSMESRHFWDGSIPWVTPKDMKQFTIGDSILKVTEVALQQTSLQLIHPPAVLMVVRGMILARKVPIAWTNAPVTINQDMKALKPIKGINAEFLASFLVAAQEAFTQIIDEAGHGTRRLPTEQWRNIAIVIPPEQEQQVIVRYLNEIEQTHSITKERIQREIVLVREYRTRLIADVVTGKLDVREAAVQLPEEIEALGIPDEGPEGDDEDDELADDGEEAEE